MRIGRYPQTKLEQVIWEQMRKVRIRGMKKEEGKIRDQEKRKTVAKETDRQEEKNEKEMEIINISQANSENNKENEKQDSRIQDNNKEHEQEQQETVSDNKEENEHNNNKEEQTEQNNKEEEKEDSMNKSADGEYSDSLPMEIKNIKAIDLYVDLNCEQVDHNKHHQGVIQGKNNQQGRE
ncbi:hypothetical protein K7X08_026394 [Anisodus acutangulus]|uniref:Uncharacterized protein n=1 Tax=Anisodus acutangulus TaxID=402998 RepID=A0A9Q1LPD2_9SOLA|nr:hypothetical protein K7X08_026394 [Anisodus acutangulus]